MGLKGYFIQYKFIVPNAIKHSSYTYQKLFRALYGYTQAVHKSTGKRYHYHRNGVLSNTPYIRPGKNCVIIPSNSFQKLIEFFKTGRNPTHNWRWKGDWKAVYYMNEKDVDEQAVVLALEALLDRVSLTTPENTYERIETELENITSKDNQTIDEQYKAFVLSEAQQIVDLDWFRSTYNKSDRLKRFHALYKQLKSK